MAAPSVSIGTLDRPSFSQLRIPAQRALFGALAIATGAPLICLGFGLRVFHQNQAGTMAALMPIIMLTGNGHVGATAFFYFDHDLLPLVRQNRQRFLLYPALAARGCLALSLLSANAWTILLIGYFAWQLYHYSRQNYGLVAFAAQSCGAGKLPTEINSMLDLGVAAAIVRTVSVSALTFQISAVLFFISSVMMLKTLRAIDWRKNLGFWSYAIAHGAQYLIFMFVISANQKRSIVGALLFLLALTAAMMVIVHLNSFKSGVAIYTGLVMGHFLIDAKVWRLREPLQRDLIRSRFGFIF